MLSNPTPTKKDPAMKETATTWPMHQLTRFAPGSGVVVLITDVTGAPVWCGGGDLNCRTCETNEQITNTEGETP